MRAHEEFDEVAAKVASGTLAPSDLIGLVDANTSTPPTLEQLREQFFFWADHSAYGDGYPAAAYPYVAALEKEIKDLMEQCFGSGGARALPVVEVKFGGGAR